MTASAPVKAPAKNKNNNKSTAPARSDTASARSNRSETTASARSNRSESASPARSDRSETMAPAQSESIITKPSGNIKNICKILHLERAIYRGYRVS